MCRLEWNRALLTVSLTSDVDVSIPVFAPEKGILTFTVNIS